MALLPCKADDASASVVSQEHLALSGSWAVDGRPAAVIDGGWIQFPGGSRTPLLNSSVALVSWDADGQICEASLDSAGRLAVSDGDVWVRHSPAKQSRDAEAAMDKLAPTQVPIFWVSLLALSLLAVVTAELILICRPSVPWLLDKVYFLTALVFQMAMAAFPPLCRLGVPKRFTSLLMDVVHWAFVVLVFAAPFVLRAIESVTLLVATVTLSVLFRLGMANTCIITVVAERTSLPGISDTLVTTFFVLLFLVSVTRFVLEIIYGSGFPIDQLIHFLFG